MEPKGKTEQNQERGQTKDLRTAEENIRKAQGDDATGEPVDPKRTGNKPRFDRDR